MIQESVEKEIPLKYFENVLAVHASRKRQQKGNTVSDETVMYGYWSSVTGLDL
jgi:hypothetical protein